MDSENFAPAEAPTPPTMLPMRAALDEAERHRGTESDARAADDGATVEHDWVTERMMDSYN